MLPVERYQRFSTAGVLTTGQSELQVMPAVDGYQYALLNGVITCLISAAQPFYLGDASGTKKALEGAASLGANSQLAFQLLQGYELTVSESIVLKPDAAGPSLGIIAEGYIIKHTAAINTTA